MRILQLMARAGGGVPAHVRQIVDLLTDAGHSVLVAGPADTVCRYPDRAEVEIGSSPSKDDLRAIRKISQLAAEFDVVHAHGLRAGALACLADTGAAKVVVTLHNKPVGSRAVRLVGSVLLRIIAAKADTVLGVSPDLVEWATSAHAQRSELALVPAPSRGIGKAQRFLDATGLGNTPIILQVARLSVQKGLDLFLAALHRVNVPYQAVIIGDGPEHSRLEKLAEGTDVHFLGRRDDIADALAAASVFVSTAGWEGQPVAIQEALIAGVPVVATDVGGTSVVTGKDGALLVPRDPEQIAEAITSLLQDAAKRASAAKRARAAASRLPSPAQVLDSLLRIYSLNRSAPRRAER